MIAVDWSGARHRAERKIWLGEAVGGRLLRLEGGRDRSRLVDALIEAARDDPDLVVGIDFAFSLPARFMREQGFASAEQLWRAPHGLIEGWLTEVPPPFYGKGGRKLDPEWADDLLRRTDRERGSASPFLLAGPKQVGTGSLRGFAHLARLKDEGFTIWPFEPPAFPLVVEIYPRAITPGVVKTRTEDRAHYLARFPALAPEQVARAQGSDDAFDAAASALEMARRPDEFRELDPVPDELARLEGRIWA